MKEHTPRDLRNVCFIGHGSVGKTSLCDSLLLAAGAVERLGSVTEGTSVFDYSPESRDRRQSLSSSIATCEWKNCRINIIDTPGFADFYSETIGAVAVSDGAVLVLDCASGVEVGSLQTWGFASNAKVPVFIWVNRIDRENADFDRVIAKARETLNRRIVPLSFPAGSGSSFAGIVDVLSGTAVDASGKPMPVPESERERLETWRHELVESAAESDEALMESFFANNSLAPEELDRGLRIAVAGRQLFPVFCGNSVPPCGQGFLLDGLASLIPSPLDRRPEISDQGQEIRPDPSGPFVARVFKSTMDRHVGDMVYFRVLRGGVEGSAEVMNSTKGVSERLGNYYLVSGGRRIDAERLVTGDIAAAAKLKSTTTNDTICDRQKPVQLVPVSYPAPVYRAAIAPKKRGEEDKMGAGLSKLSAQDPSFVFRIEPEIGQTTVSGMGEQHLSTMLNRLRDYFGVEAELSRPRIAYHETISWVVSGQYKHKKQTGGRGQYGHVFMRLEPLPRGAGFQFASEVVGGTVPTKFIPAVEKGVLECLDNGPVAGSKVVDVKAVVYDGSSHPVDSSDMAFKLAASKCFKQLMLQASPQVLEPIMNLEITVPEEFMGDVIGDINSRRGRIQGMDAEGGFQVIRALAPEAELYQYTSALRSLTQARGSFSQSFSHYEPVPREIQERIMAETAREEED
ncbi:elongation factor G [Candidatus Fermentibacteria bacterium]|nr:elongation factor G [Candidatus Fermentibacteria bacterium]